MNPLKGIQTFLSYFSTLQEHEYVGAYSPYDRIVYVRRINPPELSIICQITEGGMELPAPTPEEMQALIRMGFEPPPGWGEGGVIRLPQPQEVAIITLQFFKTTGEPAYVEEEEDDMLVLTQEEEEEEIEQEEMEIPLERASKRRVPIEGNYLQNIGTTMIEINRENGHAVLFYGTLPFRVEPVMHFYIPDEVRQYINALYQSLEEADNLPDDQLAEVDESIAEFTVEVLQHLSFIIQRSHKIIQKKGTRQLVKAALRIPVLERFVSRLQTAFETPEKIEVVFNHKYQQEKEQNTISIYVTAQSKEINVERLKSVLREFGLGGGKLNGSKQGGKYLIEITPGILPNSNLAQTLSGILHEKAGALGYMDHEASILYDSTRREAIMQIKSTGYVTETRQR